MTLDREPFAPPRPERRPRAAVRRDAAWPAERPSGCLGARSVVSRWQLASPPSRHGLPSPAGAVPDHGGPRAALGVVAPRCPAAGRALDGPVHSLGQPPAQTARVGDCPASAPGAGSGRRRRHGGRDEAGHGLGWQRCELGEQWWAWLDLNLGPHPYQDGRPSAMLSRIFAGRADP
jgi:hypothetical protein